MQQILILFHDEVEVAVVKSTFAEAGRADDSNEKELPPKFALSASGTRAGVAV
ncbi:hypothetical protein HMI46_02265 [Paenibacillus alvei]|uniref:Uncharacterized protein n=1 Tax=Paenibacillus alvei TaxID=44250 RepID=A0AAP7DGE1_PAEAL|nr:hypothetical protein [Paenibacillus alvei]